MSDDHTRRRQLLTDRFNEIGYVANRTEKALVPFADQKITDAILRLRKRFVDAGMSIHTHELERADLYCTQCEGTLIELRTLAKQAGIPGSQFIDRMVRP